MNILVTGCFAPGTAGTVAAIKSSRFGEESLVFGLDLKDQGYIPEGIERVFELKYETEDQYFNKLKSLITSENIQILLPQTTNEIQLLSKIPNGLLGNCKVSLAGNFETVTRANNKLSLLVASKKIGLSTAKFADGAFIENFKLLAEESCIAEKNLYFKHKNLSGGRGVCRVVSDEKYMSFTLEKPSTSHLMPYGILMNIIKDNPKKLEEYLLMEEFIGEEFSVDLFFDGAIELIVPRKRLLIKAGVSHVNLVEKNLVLIEAARNLGRELGLQGIFGFQFILTQENKYSVIESNPRIQGTSYATFLAGSNFIEYEICRLLEYNYEVNEPVWGSKFYRLTQGLMLHE